MAPLIPTVAIQSLDMAVNRGRSKPFVLQMLALIGNEKCAYGNEDVVMMALANPEYSDLTVFRIASHQGQLDRAVCIDDVLKLPVPRDDRLLILLLEGGARVTPECSSLLEGRSTDLQAAVKWHLQRGFLNRNFIKSDGFK